MAVLVLCSPVGSPGATTTALGLALGWPRDVLLADCDRDPAQAVLAGYLRGLDAGGRSLVGLAQVYREAGALESDLLRHCVPLNQDGHAQRRHLPGFTSAGTARLFEHVWGPLGEAFASLDRRGIDVIVDAGRVTHHGLPLALLTSADAVVVCVRSSLRSLAGLRIHLATLSDQLASLPVPVGLGLAVVGPDRPYSSGEIAAQFGVPVWARPPWDPRAAAVLSDGEDEPRHFSSSRLLGALRDDARVISERLARGRDRASGMVPA